MSIHSELPPEQSNETLAAGSPPEPGAPHTVRADITPVSSTGAQCFGEYEVVGELGEGGMGRVYKARHRTLGQFVAVKVLTLNDPSGRERFRSEALTTAKLEHANIVRVIDVQIPPDGRPYLVMEFADGGSLDRELNNTPQNPYRAAEMLETITRAVQFAHEHGVLHRDLKPANVLRTRDGTLKLTDFGLAKQMESVSGLTRTGALLGTPQYMAPEQADGRTHEFGPAVDIYALGAILYEMLTGRPPFRGVTVMETLEQVRRDEPAPPSRLVPRLPRDLSVICLKCLEKAPGRRYHTAGELADDLRRWLKGEPIVARAAPRWEKAWRQIARRPWEAAAVAASVLLLALLAGVWVIEERRAARDRDREDRAALQAQIDEANKRAEAERATERDRAAEKLRKQADESLAALDKVRDLVLDGELSRTPNLGKLHEALGAYYKGLLAQKDTGFDRAKLAEGLVKVGDLFRRTGDKAQAKLAYDEAATKCAGSDDLRVRRAGAEAVLKAARAEYELGTDDVAARKEIEEARALWERLRAEETEPAHRASAVVNCAEVLHLSGELYNRARDFARADEQYSRSIDLRRELARTALERSVEALAALPPAERERELLALRDLGRGYGYRGDVRAETGRAAEADRDYWESHRVREKVARVFPKDARTPDAGDARQQLGRSWGNFAGMHGRSGALGTALYFAELSLKEHGDLVQADTANLEFKFDLWARMNGTVELRLLIGTGDPLAGLPPLNKLEDLPLDASTEAGGHSRRARAVLATAHALRATAHAARGDARAAREEARMADLLFADLCAERAGTNVDPAHLYFHAAALAMMAETEALAVGATDRRRAALAALDRAAGLRFRDRHPADIARFRAFAAFRPPETASAEQKEDAKQFAATLDKFRAAATPAN
jgi:predicted Ser/Thr protein kinase